jgi:hypothetical protein
MVDAPGHLISLLPDQMDSKIEFCSFFKDECCGVNNMAISGSDNEAFFLARTKMVNAPEKFKMSWQNAESSAVLRARTMSLFVNILSELTSRCCPSRVPIRRESSFQFVGDAGMRIPEIN